MAALSTALTWLRRAATVVATALLVAVLVLTLGQVIMRFVVGSPLFWSEEVSRYSYVALVLTGSIALAVRQEHIRIELSYARWPRFEAVVDRVGRALVVVGCAAYVIGGADAMSRYGGGHSAAIGLPNWVLIGVAWVSLGVIGLVYLGHTLKRERRERPQVTAEEVPGL